MALAARAMRKDINKGLLDKCQCLQDRLCKLNAEIQAVQHMDSAIDSDKEGVFSRIDTSLKEVCVGLQALSTEPDAEVEPYAAHVHNATTLAKQVWTNRQKAERTHYNAFVESRARQLRIVNPNDDELKADAGIESGPIFQQAVRIHASGQYETADCPTAHAGPHLELRQYEREAASCSREACGGRLEGAREAFLGPR